MPIAFIRCQTGARAARQNHRQTNQDGPRSASIMREFIIGNNGRNGRQQTQTGSKKSLSDARRNDGQISVARHGNCLKAVHNAPYRAKKTDKGRNCADEWPEIAYAAPEAPFRAPRRRSVSARPAGLNFHCSDFFARLAARELAHGRNETPDIGSGRPELTLR